MNFELFIRKLAKRIDQLNIFTASKEVNGITLFKNSTEFSKLQQTYLNYLYFYKSIYEDINSKKVSEKVLSNEIYEDAYSYYRLHKEDKTRKPIKGIRKLQAVFGDPTDIKFPSPKEEVK